MTLPHASTPSTDLFSLGVDAARVTRVPSLAMDSEATTPIQVKRFPRALWRRVKLHALAEGLSAKQVVIAALTAYLNQRGAV